jgi:valyl-tRNA synthetase
LGKKDNSSEKLGELAKQIISEIRKWKQENNVKLGEYVEVLKIRHPTASKVQKVSEIVCRTARVNELKLSTGKLSVSA